MKWDLPSQLDRDSHRSPREEAAAKETSEFGQRRTERQWRLGRRDTLQDRTAGAVQVLQRQLQWQDSSTSASHWGWLPSRRSLVSQLNRSVSKVEGCKLVVNAQIIKLSLNTAVKTEKFSLNFIKCIADSSLGHCHVIEGVLERERFSSFQETTFCYSLKWKT